MPKLKLNVKASALVKKITLLSKKDTTNNSETTGTANLPVELVAQQAQAFGRTCADTKQSL